MEETTTFLAQSRSATISGAGTATVEFRNGGISRWKVKLMNVSNPGTLAGRCTVYRGEVSANRQIDFTAKGTDVSPVDLELTPNEFITVVWTGCTPGTIVTYRIEGDDIYKGRRAY